MSCPKKKIPLSLSSLTISFLTTKTYNNLKFRNKILVYDSIIKNYMSLLDNYIFSSGRDSDLHCWKWNSLTKKYKFEGSIKSDGKLVCALFLHRNLLYLGGDSSEIKVYDPIEDLSNPIIIIPQKFNVYSIFCYENYLFSGDTSGILSIWKIDENYKLYKTIEVHQKTLRALFAENEILISAGYDGLVILWDISKDFEQINTLSTEKKESVLTVQSKFNLLAMGGYDKMVHVWDITNKKEAIIVKIIKVFSEWVSWLILTDNHRLYTCSFDKLIRIFDMNNDYSIIKEINIHSDSIRMIMIKNHYLISSGWDKKVCVCDLDGNLIQTLLKHTGYALYLA